MTRSLSEGGGLRAPFGVCVALFAVIAGCAPGVPAPGSTLTPREDAPHATAASVVDGDSAEPDTQGAPLAERAHGATRVIVGLKAQFVPEGNLDAAARDAQRKGIAQAQAAVLRRHASELIHVSARYQTIPFLAVTVDDVGLDLLRRDPGVTSVTADHLHRPSLAQSVPLVHAPQAWASGASGEGVAVAVLDTGVDKSHPFLTGKVIAEACYSTTDPFLSLTSVCPGGAPSSSAVDSGLPCPADTSGCDHGTHVAGIVAGHDATSSGVAPNASIVAIQVFSKVTDPACYPARTCAMSTESDEVQALEHVLQLAQGGMTIASVNMSLGGQGYSHTCDADFPATKAAIDNLRSANVATVIASGNDGNAGKISHPACISTAISVGATTKADQVDVSYSNSASFLTLLAPGTDIRSSVPGGGFAVFSGTSMATPHVAAAYAVLRSGNPDVTVDEATDALATFGVSILDPRNQVRVPRIEIDRAVDATGVVRVAAPSFAPPAGAYEGVQDVVLSSDTPNASIRYTVDGSTPSPTNGVELASGASITVPANETIAAMAYTTDGKTSSVRYATYALHGAAPVFAPGDGEYVHAPTVTLTAPTADTVLHYTSDGTTPTSSHGTLLTSGDTVAITSASTLRAVASKPGWNDSPVSVARYVLVGDLTVDLLPAGAASAGARWRRMDSASDGFESGALNRFDYTQSGDGAWTVSNDQPRYGGYALRTPDLVDDQHVSVSANVTTDGGSISFSRKVSSEEGYDLLTFLVDGVEEGSWSGEVDWSTVTVSVRPGEHTFTWTYTKDFIGSAGSDAAWIDQISFPGDQWRPSGDTVRLTSTSQRIAFAPLAGWTAPVQQTVTTVLGTETHATGTYVALQASAPWFDPPAGSFKSAQSLTIASTTPDATIRYTLDGSAPTSNSPAYAGPIALGVNTITQVRAVAQVPGWLDSPESAGTWTITNTVAAPTFDPPAGTYLDAVSLTIASATPGAVIHYTLDGTPPGPTTPTYSGPIALDQNHTVEVRARAYLDAWGDSTVNIGRFVVGSPVTLTQDVGTAAAPLAAGRTATLNIEGGVGPFTVDVSANAAGVEVTPTRTDDRAMVFAAPVVGAFAGVYAVSATDDTTGAVGQADVIVAPTLELSSLSLTPTAKLSTVTVRGAKPSEAVALSLIDEQGNPVTGIADIQAIVPATNAPEQGNPASSGLVLGELTVATTVRVQATAGGVTVVSDPVSLAPAVDPQGTGGCACDAQPGAPANLALAALGAWLVRRRRAPKGAAANRGERS